MRNPQRSEPITMIAWAKSSWVGYKGIDCNHCQLGLNLAAEMVQHEGSGLLLVDAPESKG